MMIALAVISTPAPQLGQRVLVHQTLREDRQVQLLYSFADI